MKPLPLLDVVQVSEVLKQLQDCALSRAGLKHLKMFLYSCSFLRTPTSLAVLEEVVLSSSYTHLLTCEVADVTQEGGRERTEFFFC